VLTIVHVNWMSVCKCMGWQCVAQPQHNTDKHCLSDADYSYGLRHRHRGGGCSGADARQWLLQCAGGLLKTTLATFTQARASDSNASFHIHSNTNIGWTQASRSRCPIWGGRGCGGRGGDWGQGGKGGKAPDRGLEWSVDGDSGRRDRQWLAGGTADFAGLEA
jgi:hypothetical protein